MKAKTRIVLLLLFGLLVFTASCGKAMLTDKEQKFSHLFPNVRMTDQLVVRYIDSVSSDIDFLLENQTQDYLYFSVEQSIHIYVYEEENWVRINNRAGYFGKTEAILSPKSIEPEKSLFAIPISPDYNGSSVIRIVVIFSVYRNNQVTNEKVGVYIDVER